MEFHFRSFVITLLLLLSLSFPLSLSYTPFSPADNHLINCGSGVDATVDNRLYAGDHSSRKLPFCPSDRSVALRNEGPSADSSQLYDTARVFKKPSEYKFEISEEGTHMVRLHFQSLSSSEFDFGNAQFHVLVDKYVVLSNFNGRNSVKETPLVKEYLIWVSSKTLVIRFLPTESHKFAFVNAIEVISAPKDLVPNSAMFLNSDETENFNGWSNQALEVVHRVNVGGPKVTPFNDTLWRTWVTDDEYLESSFGLEKVYFGGRIKYQSGGASREIGPDNVYKSARLIRSHNASIPDINMTWVFPVAREYKYLVRLHFCDIASISLELLFFNVYVNGKLAFENFDLSMVTNEVLASPFYGDVVVDSDGSGVLKVSVGPSNYSMAYAIDGILNGVEIMKLSNSMGSFDGPHSADVVLRHWPGRTGLLIPLIAAVLLVLSLSIVLRRRMIENKESIGWSKLPVNVSEFNAKLGV